MQWKATESTQPTEPLESMIAFYPLLIWFICAPLYITKFRLPSAWWRMTTRQNKLRKIGKTETATQQQNGREQRTENSNLFFFLRLFLILEVLCSRRGGHAASLVVLWDLKINSRRVDYRFAAHCARGIPPPQRVSRLDPILNH